MCVCVSERECVSMRGSVRVSMRESVCERERERECVCVCVSARERECV